MGKTEKTTDIWGDTVEIHYDDNGNKIGKTTFETTWTGDTVQVHRDTSGNKTGTTKSDTTWTGESIAVHRDASGNETGHTKNDTSIMGDPIQRHYNTDGNKVGKSTYEQDLWGENYKKHTGDFHKAHLSKSNEKSTYSSSSDYSGASYSSGSYESASSGGGYGLHILAVIGVVIVVAISLSSNSYNSGKLAQPTTEPAQESLNKKQHNYNSNNSSPQSVEQQQRSTEALNPPAQEETPRQEDVQPPSEKVEEQARTIREFRVPMNPSIAAANDFTAEVRLPDGRTESVTITGLTKDSDTLYVTLAQDYPEGTVVTIYPKIEYSNRFIVLANPGILTSPSVSVTVQLPDGRSFQPCVQNIQRGMTQLVVTTCDNYPTGTRVIVTPVYGGYRRY